MSTLDSTAMTAAALAVRVRRTGATGSGAWNNGTGIAPRAAFGAGTVRSGAIVSIGTGVTASEAVPLSLAAEPAAFRVRRARTGALTSSPSTATDVVAVEGSGTAVLAATLRARFGLTACSIAASAVGGGASGAPAARVDARRRLGAAAVVVGAIMLVSFGSLSSTLLRSRPRAPEGSHGTSWSSRASPVRKPVAARRRDQRIEPRPRRTHGRRPRDHQSIGRPATAAPAPAGSPWEGPAARGRPPAEGQRARHRV